MTAQAIKDSRAVMQSTHERYQRHFLYVTGLRATLREAETELRKRAALYDDARKVYEQATAIHRSDR